MDRIKLKALIERLREAKKQEEYELCQAIETEVNHHVAKGEITQDMLDVFKLPHPETGQLVGEPQIQDVAYLFRDLRVGVKKAINGKIFYNRF